MLRHTMYKQIILVMAVISSMIFGTGIALGDNTESRNNEVNLVATYYTNANIITNDYFKKVLTFFDELDIEDPNYLQEIQTNLLPPENLESRDFAACQESLSSICLQIELENLYMLSERQLLAVRNSISPNTGPNAATDFASFTSVNDVRREFIDEQLNFMRNINTQSLEFYRQLLFAYPIHIQNQKTKEGLKDFLDNLRQLERNLAPYSGIFHNVTTAQCI
jgi:hypothetical protein